MRFSLSRRGRGAARRERRDRCAGAANALSMRMATEEPARQRGVRPANQARESRVRPRKRARRLEPPMLLYDNPRLVERAQGALPAGRARARATTAARCRSRSRGRTGISRRTRSAASRRSTTTASCWPSRTRSCATSRSARAARISIRRSGRARARRRVPRSLRARARAAAFFQVERLALGFVQGVGFNAGPPDPDGARAKEARSPRRCSCSSGSWPTTARVLGTFTIADCAPRRCCSARATRAWT